MHIVAVLAILAFAGLLPPARAQSRQTNLRIVVIEGESAVNIIQQRTATAPIVEVRDRNDLPVAGAIVTFSVGGSGSASFAGASTLTVITNAAGQAAATGLTPLTTGALQIQATALFQGQTVVATIAQTNVATAAAASSAASGSAAAGGGGASGGGVSTQTLAILGGAAVAGGVVAATRVGGDDPPAFSITISPAITGIVSMTDFTFNAAKATGDVAWDFGDGQSATGASVTHRFNREGTFQVTARGSTGQTASASVVVAGLDASWSQPYPTVCTPVPPHVTCVRSDIITLSVSGNTLTGIWRLDYFDGNPSFSPISGSINGRSLLINQLGECFRILTATLSDDARSFRGQLTYASNTNPVCQGSFAAGPWTRQ